MQDPSDAHVSGTWFCWKELIETEAACFLKVRSGKSYSD